MSDGILYCFNLNPLIIFQVGSRKVSAESPMIASAILGKYEKHAPLDDLKIHYQRFFELIFIKWTKLS